MGIKDFKDAWQRSPAFIINSKIEVLNNIWKNAFKSFFWKQWESERASGGKNKKSQRNRYLLIRPQEKDLDTKNNNRIIDEMPISSFAFPMWARILHTDGIIIIIYNKKKPPFYMVSQSPFIIYDLWSRFFKDREEWKKFCKQFEDKKGNPLKADYLRKKFSQQYKAHKKQLQGKTLEKLAIYFEKPADN